MNLVNMFKFYMFNALTSKEKNKELNLLFIITENLNRHFNIEKEFQRENSCNSCNFTIQGMLTHKGVLKKKKFRSR